MIIYMLLMLGMCLKLNAMGDYPGLYLKKDV